MNTKIDVIVVTYNQKDYIKLALDSIISQNCVSFRIIVHDDCSTDGTKEIIEEYSKKYKDLIYPIYEQKRTFPDLGFNRMLFERIAPFVKSRYIAYCDGDDYWCDSNKLSMQLSFLENHIDYSMCFCSSYCLDSDGSMKNQHFIKNDGDITIDDLLCDKDGIDIATSSIFMKSEVFLDFPSWRLTFPVEDFPMYLNACLFGKIYRIGRPMSVYRRFSYGSWSLEMKDFTKRINNIALYKEGMSAFNDATNKKYSLQVVKLFNFYNFKLAYYARDFDVLFLKKNRCYFKRISFFERVSFYLQYKHPKFYSFLKRFKK